VKFSEIIGQEKVKAEIIKEINSGKIAHAKLFHGKSGYGTLPLALAFVQYLFCEQKTDSDSCGICPSCKRVREFTHPDVHYVYPIVKSVHGTSMGAIEVWRKKLSENPYFDLLEWGELHEIKNNKLIIPTEESVEIIKKLNFKSYEGGAKVMLIWMPEEMHNSCSNKLLKILEEPPQNTYFLLIAENQDRMLNTILSRTQKVEVPRIELADLSNFMQKKSDLNREEADFIASFSEGDYLMALSYIEESEAKDFYREQFIQMMRSSYKKDVLGMLDWADKFSSQPRERQKFFFIYSLHMFRQSIMMNYIGEELTHVTKEEEHFLKNFSPFISGNNIREFQETFNDGYYHIERNANSKILFTQLCFQTMRYIHAA
jgi:DNA polymerase-3 subunit delta'